MDPHGAPVELEFFDVTAAVVRSEPLGGDLLGQFQDRFHGLSVVIAEEPTREQGLHIEPLEEQEGEVSAGQ